MIEFTVGEQRYIAVQMDDGANAFVVENPNTDKNTFLFWKDEHGSDDNMMKLPRADYEILGLVGGLSQIN